MAPGSTDSLSGLQPETAYKVRFAVVDSEFNRTSYGPFTSFTTTPPPDLWTPVAPSMSTIGWSWARVNLPTKPEGWVDGWQLQVQVYSNDEQTLISAGGMNNWPPGSTDSLSGLQPETAYKVRFAVVDSEFNRTSYGPFTSFTTTPPPDLWTPVAPSMSTIGWSWARVNLPTKPEGWVDGWQLQVQVYSNDEQTLISAGGMNNWPPGSTDSLSGLQPETAYKVRFAVVDSEFNRTSYGPFTSFTTTPPPDFPASVPQPLG